MGIKFQRAKIIETTDSNGTRQTSVQTYSDSDHPVPMPIMGTIRVIDEGKASKVNVPYSETYSTAGGLRVNYKTVWVPIGQEGWTVKIQCRLKYKPLNAESEYDPSYDEIYNWQSVDPGQLLQVESNQCDELGQHDTDRAAYKRLDPLSLWYVDKILIQSISGVQEMAQMEMSLVRCWLA